MGIMQSHEGTGGGRGGECMYVCLTVFFSLFLAETLANDCGSSGCAK